MISEEDGSLREMRDAAERKRLKAEEKRAAEHDRRERLKKGWTDHYQPPLTEAEKLVRKQRRCMSRPKETDCGLTRPCSRQTRAGPTLRPPTRLRLAIQGSDGL